MTRNFKKKEFSEQSRSIFFKSGVGVLDILLLLSDVNLEFVSSLWYYIGLTQPT